MPATLSAVARRQAKCQNVSCPLTLGFPLQMKEIDTTGSRYLVESTKIGTANHKTTATFGLSALS